MKKALILLTGLMLICAGASLAGEIHEAAGNGEIATLQTILKTNQGIVNEKNSQNQTPLHLAAMGGHLEAVKVLLEAGADINLGDNENSPPIVNAALGGYFEVVEYMIKNGASATQLDDNNMEPIHFAAMSGEPRIIRLLIENGADVNAGNARNVTPLIYSAYRGKLDGIKVMMELGADHKITTVDGATCLHGAANFGSVETCQYFIENGIDINVTDDNMRTPLFDAVARGRQEAATYLLSQGARTDITDSTETTILHEAAHGGNVEIIEQLIAAGGDVNAVNQGGMTVLHFALFGNRVEVVNTLLAHGADPNIANNGGQTPIFQAYRHTSPEVCQVLLDGGADPNHTESKEGRTVLHCAAMKGAASGVEQLLASGADFNIRDFSGMTALEYACKYAHKTVADVLIAKGASDKGIKKNFGPCPLLKKTLADKEAVVWYTGHAGWAVKTKNNFLLFDFWGRDTVPDNPCISNGYINAEEVKGLPMTVFVSHSHRDHYDPTIFSWRESKPDIKYVIGFEPDSATGYEYMGPRETRNIDGIDITTITSNDEGVGFLVEVDGLTIFHAGDHANRQRDFSGPFQAEIDYLAEKNLDIDMAFMSISGCGFGDLEAVKLGVYYTLEKLAPKSFFAQHSIDSEYRYKEFRDEAQSQNFKSKFICAGCRGDHFVYKNGIMAF